MSAERPARPDYYDYTYDMFIASIDGEQSEHFRPKRPDAEKTYSTACSCAVTAKTCDRRHNGSLSWNGSRDWNSARMRNH